MRHIVIILSACLFILVGCTNEFKTGEGDLFYKFHDDKNGETVKEGDFVAVSYIEQTEEGSTIYNSNDEDGRPAFMFREASRFKADFFSALGMLSEGDSATFKINLDSIVTKTERKKPNTKGKYLVYTIKMNKVIARGKLTDSLYNSAIEAYKKEEIGLAKQQEPAKINFFLASKKLNPTSTASGLNYTLIKKGAGATAAIGDSVEVNYTAKYFSGKVFETNLAEMAKKANIFNSSRKYKPVRLAIISNKPVSGFFEAAMLFPQGTKATLIIPSKLAYASTPYHGLRPYTPLLCDIEIIRILHAN